MSDYQRGDTCKWCVWWSREPYRTHVKPIKPSGANSGFCRLEPAPILKHRDEWCGEFKRDKGRIKR